jgi:hypothetical protein
MRFKLILFIISILFYSKLSFSQQCGSFSGPSTVCPNSTTTLVLNSGYKGNGYLLLRDNNIPEGSWQYPTQDVQVLFWPVSKAGTYKLSVSGSACVTGQVVLSIDNSTPQNNLSIASSVEAPNYCLNQALTLTASGGNGSYSWSGSDGSYRQGTSISITLAGTVTYTLSSTVNGSCSSSYFSTSRTFTVKPQVATPAIPTGTPSRCKGAGTDTYTVPTNSYDSYSWSISSTPASSNTIDQYTGKVTWDPNFAGTAAVTVTFTGCGGSQSRSKTVYVNDYPLAPSGSTSPDKICRAQEVTFYATSNNPPASGIYHIWYSSSNKSSVIPSSVVSATTSIYQTKVTASVGSTTTYYVSSVSDGCESALTPVTVTLSNVSLSATGADLCGNGEATLTASAPAGSIYTWIDPNGNTVASGTTPKYTTPYLSNTISQDPQVINYSVRIDVPNACSATFETPVRVYLGYDAPTASVSPICYSGTATITPAGGPSNKTFIWMFYDSDGTVLPSSNTATSYTTPNLTADKTYYVAYQLTQTPGCLSRKVPITVKVYPKPSLPVTTASTYTLGDFDEYKVNATPGANGDVVRWYESATGSVVFEGNSYTSFSDCKLSKSIYLSTYNSVTTCESDKKTVTLNVGPNYCKNYIRTWDVLKDTVTTEAAIDALAVKHVLQKTSYFDGLGRFVQEVVKQQSPSSTPKDIVTQQDYDNLGRPYKKYLPYTGGTDGNFKTNFITEQTAFYKASSDKIVNDDYPYALTDFEASPLNRVAKQGAPGLIWQPSNLISGGADKVISFAYSANSLADSVKYWKLNGAYVPKSTKYSAGELYVTSTKDEQGATVKEYKNKEDKVVLKRVQLNSTLWNDTYYIYDDLGNLKLILPPQCVATWPKDTTKINGQLKNYAFLYEYDERGRMVEKRVPGAGKVRMVYDKLDRLVLTQDSMQYLKGEWIYTKYDTLNRPILSGKFKDQRNISLIKADIEGQTKLCEKIDESTSGHGYTQSNCFPKNASNTDVLTVTYYDDYRFINKTWFEEITNYKYKYFTGKAGYNNSYNSRVRGKVTAQKVKMLRGNKYLNTVTYYDNQYRAIRIIAENNNGGADTLSTKLDFAGKVLTTLNEHSGIKVETISQRFVYDAGGRLTAAYNKIGSNNEVLISQNKYNELGQLIDKGLGGVMGNPYQSIDYRYNIRGWLTNINKSDLSTDSDGAKNDDTNDLFGMELLYEQSKTDAGL